jgi:UDP-N-acetylmuramoyl-L-alanyl-D-glutamate--2,6-diaminopimelate ligase
VNLFRVLDRGEAIEKAICLALPGDLVLITGKGCEPVMAVADGKKIPWDDRVAARIALHKRLQSV